MNVTDSDVAALATQAHHLMAAKMFSLACCVMLFYDIMITFGDEVERIWKQRFSFATVLWFMNRYLSPLGYIVIIVSFHDNWPKSICNRYVLYPEVLKVFTSAAIGVIFILRLYSVYGGSMIVLVAMSVLLVAELVVKIWAFTDGTSVNLPPGLVGCILTGRDNANDRFVFTWVAELIFDSIVFIATLSRTLVIYRRHRQGAAIPLIKIMMRDGIIYFLVIFVANVVTVTLFVTLPPDLKAVNASFSTLITSLMVSRLILNLRNQAMRPRAAVVSYSSCQIPPEQDRLTSTVIGNLGEPIENTWFNDDDDAKADDDEDDERRDQNHDTYAMGNLYRTSDTRKQVQQPKQHASSTIGTGSIGQILVEVTQTRSVISDVLTQDQYAHGYPYDSEDLRLQRLDDGSRSFSREDSLAAAPGLAVSHPFSGERPRSAQTRSRQHENSFENSDGESEGSGSSRYQAGRTRRRKEEVEDRERPRMGAWRPPPTWMLENVDVYELGRPRRSRRRPGTS